MCRCSECNAAAFELVQPKEAVQGRVPQRVYDMVDEFWVCGACGKLFWLGPKSLNAMDMLRGLMQRLPKSQQAAKPGTAAPAGV